MPEVETPTPRSAFGGVRSRAWILLIFLPLAFLDWGAIYSTVAYRPAESFYGLEVRFSRAGWLPGPRLLVPTQACPACVGGDHHSCAQVTQRLRLVADPTSAGAPPQPLSMSTSGAVEISGTANGGSEFQCDQLVLEGVAIEPGRFNCLCCSR